VAAHQAGDLVHGQPRSAHRAQRRPGEREHGRARFGEPAGPARTVQQFLAQRMFQLPDLGAHARLRDVQFRRGPGEVPLVRDNYES
jgi:hypothetical protein